MLPHLVYISKEYDQIVKLGIHPISEIDCEIITELINLAMSKGDDKLVSILSKWKALTDQKILDKIIEYQNETEDPQHNFDSLEVGKKEGLPFPYIEIQDTILAIYYIRSMNKVSRFDRKLNREIFSILINKSPMPQKFDFYVDTLFDYNTEEERDSELASIKEKMIKYGYVIFI